MTSVSWGMPGIHQGKDGGRSCENRRVRRCLKDIVPIYFIPVITKEADGPIDNTICQDILINVIFGCEFGDFSLE